MKKILLVILVCIGSGSVFANEVTAVWSRLYGQAGSFEHKIVIMNNIASLDDREIIPVLFEALKELNIERENIKGVTERTLQYQLTEIIINELGQMKAVEAADELFIAYSGMSDNPFMQASAIKALGDVGAKQYADEIAMLLRNINLEVIKYESRPQMETVIGAAVYSLERMKDDIGFSPVFYAATGRYSKRISDRADRALKNMVDDPTELLTEILNSDKDFNVKAKVLMVEDASDAAAENKISLVVDALDQSLLHQPGNSREANATSQVRLDCAAMLIKYGILDLRAVPLLDDMIRGNFSSTETLTAINTLGTSTSDEAATVLSVYLDELNEKRKSGYTFQNESIVRATIGALANTANTIAKPSLLQVEFSGWGGDTRRMAKKALEGLE